MVKALSQYQRAGQRNLSEKELAIYLDELSGLSRMTALALDLALYLGVQRKRGMAVGTLRNAVTEMSKRILALERIRAPFQLRDIRRTAKTQLARLRVSKDVRAQLLSHGISGVRDRYDGQYDDLDENGRRWSHWRPTLTGAGERVEAYPGKLRLPSCEASFLSVGCSAEAAVGASSPHRPQ